MVSPTLRIGQNSRDIASQSPRLAAKAPLSPNFVFLSSNLARCERLDSADVVALAAGNPLLVPDIQEAILDGRQAKGMQLEELTRAMPAEWEERIVVFQALTEKGDRA